METQRRVSGFDATQYLHPTPHRESRARDLVLAHHAAIRGAVAEGDGTFIAVIGPEGDLEALRALRPRDEGGAMWCVGRHAFADLRLQSSSEAPLRAMAVHATPGPKGHLRIIDLQTPTGFYVRGVGMCRDLTVEQAVLVETAGYTLVIIPAAQGVVTSSAVAFWDELAHPRVLAVMPAGAPIDDDDEAVVTVLRSMPVDPGTVTLRVAFELTFDNSSIMTGVSPMELRHGVLVGRYNRCSLGGRALHAMHQVSRVHLLLLLVGEKLYGFDLATTGGTTLNGTRRRYFPIAVGDRVELANQVALRVVT